MAKGETTKESHDKQTSLFQPPPREKANETELSKTEIPPVIGEKPAVSVIPSALAKVSSPASRTVSGGQGRRKQSLNRWVIITGIVVLAVLIYGAYQVLFPSATAEVSMASHQTITSAVYGTVNIEPKVQAVLRNQNLGTILKILVSKGDLVKTDQVLAELSDPNLELNIQKAQDDLKSAKERFDIGPASKEEYEGAKLEEDKLGPLAAEGTIAHSELDKATTKRKSLADKVHNEQLLLEEDVRKAEQALQEIKTTSTQNQIKASQDGIVLDIYAQVGELASPREELFLLASQETIIRARVNEEDVGMLREGMAATVKLYSNHDEDFPAKVTKILPKGDNTEYDVLLELIRRPINLLPGMTGEVNIITGKKDNALVIPSTAVFNGNRVLTVMNGRIHQVPITIGFRNVAWTEVREGLRQGDEVVIDGLESFKEKEGQRVYSHQNNSSPSIK